MTTTRDTQTSAGTRRPSHRAAKIATLLAVPAAVVASGLVVSQASYSAYSATTVNPTNNWASGTVGLTDDDAGTAAFNARNLKPGSTGTKCIAVTSTGSLPATVKLYGTTPASTNKLYASINLTITQGTGGSFGDCAGFAPLATGAGVYTGTLENLGTSATGYASGVGSWVTTGTEKEARTYQVTYTVSAQAPDSTQAGTASLGLTWEAQSN